MKKDLKQGKSQIHRAQLNAAMEDFFARGGRIKKVKMLELARDQNANLDYEDDFFSDYSPIEVSGSIPLGKGRRNADYE